MQIRILDDRVEIDGYVNAVERNSKPLMSRAGRFVERICKGAFEKALQRNDDVHILLNHDWNRDLGSTKHGNLELEEDAIGLKAHAIVTDPEVIKRAQNGDLVGWSFGFSVSDDDIEESIEHGVRTRAVKDLDLFEVSVLDRTKTPAYEGTLITTRDDGKVQYQGVAMLGRVAIQECRTKKTEKGSNVETKGETRKPDYTEAEKIIAAMKGKMA